MFHGKSSPVAIGAFALVRLAFFITAFLITSYASAQIKGFVAGGLGANTVQTEETVSAPGFDQRFTTGKSNIPAFQLEGGARFGSGDVQFGAGLLYHPLTYKADEETTPFSTIKTDVKNFMGVFGEIGWQAAPPTVIYGRLSYNRGKVQLKIQQPPFPDINQSGTFNGIGYGAGIRHSVSSNAYLFVDWHYIQGNEVSMSEPGITFKFKPSITTGLIGAGWSF